MIREIEGKKYKFSDKSTLNVGDKYYMTFTNNIQTYKDVDYGVFDPKEMSGCYKVEFVNES